MKKIYDLTGEKHGGQKKKEGVTVVDETKGQDGNQDNVSVL